jgi:hypothetical protein
MRVHRPRAGFIFAVALLLPLPVAAQAPPSSPVEIWGAFSGVTTAPSGTLASSYAPPLQLDGSDYTSSASQTLAIDGNRAPGWQAGINVFPSRHVGLQIFVDRASMDLSGVNGPYSVAMKFVEFQPPNSQPFPVDIHDSLTWPDTTGTLTLLTTGFDLVARTDPARRVVGSVSGGLAYYHLTGSIESLGFTVFRELGHAVLSSNEYHVAVSPADANIVGFNFGGDMSVAVGRHAAVLVGYRFLGRGTVDMAMQVTGITNEDQVFFGETVDTIAKQMTLTPARIDLSSSRIVVGLKLMR